MEAIRIVHWERERVVTRASRTTNGQQYSTVGWCRWWPRAFGENFVRCHWGGVGGGACPSSLSGAVGKGEPGRLDAFRPVEWPLVAEKCYELLRLPSVQCFCVCVCGFFQGSRECVSTSSEANLMPHRVQKDSRNHSRQCGKRFLNFD